MAGKKEGKAEETTIEEVQKRYEELSKKRAEVNAEFNKVQAELDKLISAQEKENPAVSTMTTIQRYLQQEVELLAKRAQKADPTPVSKLDAAMSRKTGFGNERPKM